MPSKRIICANCLASFANKWNLKRHLITAHPFQVQVNSNFFSNHKAHFECNDCQKKFSRKDGLMRHIQSCHPSEELVLFECAHCKRKFNRKGYLVRHLQTRFCMLKVCPTTIRCVLCSSYFMCKKVLNEHYKVDHQIKFVYETIHFQCFKEFEEWKNKLEMQTICQFYRYHRRQNETEVKVHYVCHRSGFYNGNPANRKRLLKVSGSKRLGGLCPAEIVVSCNQTSCVITFQSVHVGHEIGSKNELKHVYLNKEEKMKLAVKLSSGVTTTEIIRKHKLLKTDEEAAQVDIISNAVYNVRRKLKTDAHTFVFGNDELNIQSFVMQNSESILYFKDKLKNDEKYGLLENSDFMIVIMDAVQQENLRRYGHKVVAVDSTHGTSPRGFLLHTLLIVDVDFEGFPVAFALTNRNDYKGISVFFKCIKDRVGIIKTGTLMSDLQLTYFNCWSDIMQPPERHLYCMWHVYDQWKKNFKRISNVEKKTYVKQQLYSLATEMDVTVFKEAFQLFISNFDDDTKDFIEYFNTYYSVCCEKWAYCYRSDAELNTNMYLERFHSVFNKNVAKRKKIKTVTSCLQYLLEYLKIKEKDCLCKEIRGKISPKLRILRHRHKIAVKELANVNRIIVQPISYNTWLVSSFTDNSLAQETYIVKQQEQETMECGDNCDLVCTQCETCFHQYKCTCQDWSVRNNMCKHIHIVVIRGFGAPKIIVDNVGIEIISSVEVSQEQKDEREELHEEILRAKLLFTKAIERATNAEQVREIINKFVIPIEPALNSINLIPCSPDQPLHVPYEIT